MSARTPERHITDSTSGGRELLKRSAKLREAITAYVESPSTEGIELEDAHLIGEEGHSRVFVIDNIALKISSATTGIAHDDSQRATPKEDLSLQFTTLRLLQDYLHGNSEGIYVPVQFFVVSTPHTDLLGQQFMAGWISLNELVYREFGPKNKMEDSARKEVDSLSAAIAHRITRALRGFPLIDNINDLVGKKDDRISVHGSNILVPTGATLADTPPICVIDQPAPHGKSWKKINY